jgi:hypothetical protein
MQRRLFPEEHEFLHQLQSPPSIEKFSKKSALTKLQLFVNKDRIVCVGSRLSACPALTAPLKYLMMSPKSRFAMLIIRSKPCEHLHPGNAALLSFLREKCLIHEAESARGQVKPKFTQPTTDSPSARVSVTAPFIATTVDYTQHFKLRMRLAGKSSLTNVFFAIFSRIGKGSLDRKNECVDSTACTRQDASNHT